MYYYILLHIIWYYYMSYVCIYIYMLLHIIILLSYYHHYYCILPLRLLLITLKHNSNCCYYYYGCCCCFFFFFFFSFLWSDIFIFLAYDMWMSQNLVHRHGRVSNPCTPRSVQLVQLSFEEFYSWPWPISISSGVWPSIIGFFPFRRWSHPFSRHSLTFDVTLNKNGAQVRPKAKTFLSRESW